MATTKKAPAPTKTGARKTTPRTSTATRQSATAAKRTRDADWKAAKEILTAHRTLARAERRETELATTLKAHTRTLSELRAGAKKADRQLAAAKDELATSIKARKKAAERLAAIEHAEARTSRASKAKPAKHR